MRSVGAGGGSAPGEGLAGSGVEGGGHLGGVAGATPTPKPKKSCNLIVDAKGDTNDDIRLETGHTIPDGFPDSRSIDLVGADLVRRRDDHGRHQARRLRPGRAGDDQPDLRCGVQASQPRRPLLLVAIIDPLRTSYSFGFHTDGGFGFSSGPATGTITGREIRISASIEAMAADEFVGPVPVGVKISGLRAHVFRRMLVQGNTGVGSHLYQADTALSMRTYVAGRPSCLKIND